MKMENSKSRFKNVRLRFGLVMACFVLIVAAIFFLPIRRGKGSDVNPAPDRADENYRPDEPGTEELLGDFYFLRLWNYNEYCDFMKLQEMPDTFFSYDKVQGIGSFRDLGFDTPGTVPLDSRAYSYGLCDENNFNLVLVVRQNGIFVGNYTCVIDLSENDRKPTIASLDAYKILTAQEAGIQDNNLRRVTSRENIAVACGGIVYYYNEGKLRFVKWKIDNTVFYLYAWGEDLSDYPESGSDTFVHKLINAETAEEAIANMGTVYLERIPTPTPEPKSPSPERAATQPPAPSPGPAPIDEKR